MAVCDPTLVDRYVAAMAAVDGTDVTLSISGVVMAVQPGHEPRPVLGCIGSRVSRVERLDTGWRIVGREALLFTDLATGEVLSRWTNPVNGASVDVVHDWLDPVGLDLPGSMVLADRSNRHDEVIHTSWSATSRHPLRPDVFVCENADAMLQLAEHSMVSTSQTDSSVRISTVRLTPWLPWMLSAGTEGSLVFHLSARRVNSFDDLDPLLRRHVEAERPEFAFAPKSSALPAENSWTMYLAERQPVPRSSVLADNR